MGSCVSTNGHKCSANCLVKNYEENSTEKEMGFIIKQKERLMIIKILDKMFNSPTKISALIIAFITDNKVIICKTTFIHAFFAFDENQSKYCPVHTICPHWANIRKVTIAVFGAPKSGKTSLIKRFLDDEFIDIDTEKTQENKDEFGNMEYQTELNLLGIPIELHLIDVNSINFLDSNARQQSFQHVSAAIMCFDLSKDYKVFRDQHSLMMHSIMTGGMDDESPLTVSIGTKADSQITNKERKDDWRSLSWRSIETDTSAKYNTNVDFIFQHCVYKTWKKVATCDYTSTLVNQYK